MEEVTWYVTCWYYGSWRSKNVVFLAKPWRGVQLTQLYKLSWAAQSPRAGVTRWGHVQGECELFGVMCIYKWAKFNNADFLRVKRRCQLVVRLKAKEYYLELLSFLSSYINFLNLLNLKASAVGSWPLAGSRLLALDSDLRPLAILILVFAIGESFHGKVCCNPTVLRWVAWFDYIIWSIFCIISPWSLSGLRRNSPLWWITHLHSIIQQDPSAYIELLDYLKLHLDLFS